MADYNIDNGAKIQLWDNVNAEWQQWNFVAAGDGVYRIQNRFTGKMLDLDCGGVSDGTRDHQWEGAPASSQLWVVEPSNDGRVKIKSNLAGKLLDVVGHEHRQRRCPADLAGRERHHSVLDHQRSDPQAQGQRQSQCCQGQGGTDCRRGGCGRGSRQGCQEGQHQARRQEGCQGGQRYPQGRHRDRQACRR